MYTTTASENRLYTHGDHVFDNGHVKAGKHLPDPFGKLNTLVWSEYKTPRLSEKAPDKVRFDTLVSDLAIQDQKCAEWNQHIRAIVETGIEVQADLSEQEMVKLALGKFKELEPILPVVKIASPTLDYWDALAQDVPTMQGLFTQHLKTRHLDLLKGCSSSLDFLYEHHFIGVHGQHPKKATNKKYEYFRHIALHQKVGTRNGPVERETVGKQTEHRLGPIGDERNYYEETVTQYGKKQQIHQLSYRVARIEHKLFNAKESPWNVSLPTPKAIAYFLSTMKPWIRDHIRIIHGDMAQETIVEKDLGEPKTWVETTEEEVIVGQTVRRGRLWSPGVCFGPWCLAGWSNFDLDAKQLAEVARVRNLYQVSAEDLRNLF